MAKRRKPAKRGGSAKKTPMANKSKAKAASTAGGVAVVCSECYSDFLYMCGQLEQTPNVIKCHDLAAISNK